MANHGDRDDSGPDPDRFERSYDEATPASVAIVLAIASLEDVPPGDPRALGFTLYDHVDPEALDELVGDGTGTGAVRVDLELGRYAVRVDDGGRILVSSNEE